MSLADQIDQLSSERMRARAHGDVTRARELTRQIELLYDRRRAVGVAEKHGSRAEIVKRARIEVELERLISNR